MAVKRATDGSMASAAWITLSVLNKCGPKRIFSGCDQKGVNDRSEKNDGRNEIKRFPSNPPREFSEKRRNLLVMVAIDRQRKI